MSNIFTSALYNTTITYPEKIDRPSYYQIGDMEVIEIAKHLGFIKGNIVKYVVRAGKKSTELEDLKKAKWYLDYLINEIENGCV